jgi:hypothetical protein
MCGVSTVKRSCRPPPRVTEFADVGSRSAKFSGDAPSNQYNGNNWQGKSNQSFDAEF